MPDAACRERYKVGEIVWSTRYESLAKIESEILEKGRWIYRVWLKDEKWQQRAYLEPIEIASLDHLRKLGITF